MRKVAIVLAAALWLAIPAISRAQYNDSDRQDPKEYHDEDSQPLALFADVLYPVGYALEWGLARPMHWIANDSPIAPAFRPVGGSDNSPPPRVPVIPDNTMEQTTTSTIPQDWSPTRSPVTLNATVIRPVEPPAAAPAAPASISQPTLH